MAENADVVQLFVVYSKPNPAGFLRYDDHRASVRRRGVLYKASREILVQIHVHLFGHERIHTKGRDVAGELSGGTEISNGRREDEPTSVGDVEKTSANSIKVSPN